jgi:hypothetical protein
MSLATLSGSTFARCSRDRFGGSADRLAHTTKMLRSLAVLVLLAGSAVADPTVKATDKPTCKRKIVGRGLDRHVVCELTEPVIVKTSAPKPKVLIVHRDPREVVGRPRSGDRLVGLSHTLD